MQTVLVDVDTQFDFVDEGGALYVPAEQSVDDAIADALADAQDDGTPILGTVDSHAYDAWEFKNNGGPFPPHCVKGTPGWLRINHSTPRRTRFVPMQTVEGMVQNLVGESQADAGPRTQTAEDLATEASNGVGIYFEKEVYSLFSNPTASHVIAQLVAKLGGAGEVCFDVIGYCTGGYCVDAAAKGLAEQGYKVRVLAYATAAIGGDEGLAKSKAELTATGVEWIEARR